MRPAGSAVQPRPLSPHEHDLYGGRLAILTLPENPMLRDGVTLYFIRHGETDWNAVQRYQGQTDIPLNALGRSQAARNGRVLRDVLGERRHDLDYVASPLSRASETMAIARREMELEPEAFRRDARLMEQHYGHWEGELWHELPERDPVGFAARALDKWGWCPTGGESYRMLSGRIAGWLREVDRDTVVASHGAVSRALRGLVLGMEGPDVTELEVPQDRVLVLMRGRMEWV
jgi:broad specificity phosphatase PhoE